MQLAGQPVRRIHGGHAERGTSTVDELHKVLFACVRFGMRGPCEIHRTRVRTGEPGRQGPSVLGEFLSADQAFPVHLNRLAVAPQLPEQITEQPRGTCGVRARLGLCGQPQRDPQ